MRFSEPTDLPVLEAWSAAPEIRRSIDVVREAALPTAETDRAASFALVADDGCIVAECLFPGRFMLHTNLLREGRTSKGRARWEAAIGKMFVSRTGADFLFAAVPQADLAGVATLKRLGFAFSFDLARAPGSVLPAFSVYHLALHDWVARGRCARTGRRVEAEIQRQLGRPAQPDEPMRAAFLGAAFEMLAVRNLDKAIETFNAWANFARRSPIRLLSSDPVRVDVGPCGVRVDGTEIHVEEAFHA